MIDLDVLQARLNRMALMIADKWGSEHGKLQTSNRVVVDALQNRPEQLLDPEVAIFDKFDAGIAPPADQWPDVLSHVGACLLSDGFGCFDQHCALQFIANGSHMRHDGTLLGQKIGAGSMEGLLLCFWKRRKGGCKRFSKSDERSYTCSKQFLQA